MGWKKKRQDTALTCCGRTVTGAEQLRRIEQNLDGINANTAKAEKELTQMEKCCGLCLCPCTP
jgi:hypothetical protein